MKKKNIERTSVVKYAVKKTGTYSCSCSIVNQYGGLES